MPSSVLSRAVAVVALVALLLPLPIAADDTPPSRQAGTSAAASSAWRSAQPTSGRRLLGYYVPYDPTSFASLEEHVASIDIVATQWVTIDACGNLSSQDDQTLKQFARARGIAVVPSLLTLSGWLNHQLLTDEAVAAHAIEQIVEYVTVEGYDGFDLDLEAVQPQDRPAFSAFVAALASALHERGKGLALAIPAKTRDVTTGWAGAYDYAALGQHADLITIMAYEYRGAWSGPGSVAPYDWVEQVLAFATSQIPPEKVLLGLAFYGYDWNTTTPGRNRALSYGQATRLAERYQVPILLDPFSQSATFRYQAPAGEPPPPSPRVPPLQHEITVRAAPPCPIVGPSPTPTPTPRPEVPGTLQDHEVWFEESVGVAARLALADRYRAGGVATWRLGQEDPRFWPVFEQWRGIRTPRSD